MRRYLFLIPFVFACGRAETPEADTAAMAAAPAALTEADVAGTWTGTAMMEGSDSVIAHWTNICSAGTCRFTTTESPKDTVTSNYVLEADSMRATSEPYVEPMAGGAMVIDTWVARVAGSQVTGTGMAKLAERPDSVVMRYRFTGSKTM
jgi:hypothetical protein